MNPVDSGRSGPHAASADAGCRPVGKPLRALIIEDDPSDAGLLERHLRRGGFDLHLLRVDCTQSLQQALETQVWDVVISDFKLPGLDARHALQLVRGKDPDLPFLVVSGQIGEETAVDLLRAGAADYIMKDRLARLVPAIEREVSEADHHRQHRRMNAELRLLRECIEQVNEVVIVTDAQSGTGHGPRIVYVNPAFEKQTGYSAAQALGKTPRMLQGPATDPAELLRIEQALRNQQPVSGEVLNYTREEQPYWAELNIAPVADNTGTITHWVSVQRDVTERRQAQAERERLIRELEKRNAELDAYNHSVAHDLRNPIISIHGMADLAELALDGGDQARVLDCLRRIVDSARQADTLIRSLMDLAKVGKAALRVNELPALTAIQTVLADFQLALESEQAQVQLEVPAAARVRADPTLLHVMLANLVDNALKHRHPQRPPRIVVRVQTTGDPAGTQIQVQDNGIGIAADAHARVFKLFERVSQNSPGTGVGLALVDRAARLHGGRVNLLQSQEGVGSCFAVWLPD